MPTGDEPRKHRCPADGQHDEATRGRGVSSPINRDDKTIESFGYEWQRFDQSGADPAELAVTFASYFQLFPWAALPTGAVGIDLGCGSGRWARLAAPRVGRLVCVEPSVDALAVARVKAPTCQFIRGAAGELPFRDDCLDFGYSLGVLHHTPDPLNGLTDAVRSLKPGAPFLVYLYYALDNRPRYFRLLWRASDVVRRRISRLPLRTRYAVSQAIAAAVYLPLARTAKLLERAGQDVEGFPLSAYRNRNFYFMRNDAFDRFGTRLERRFTRSEVSQLMERAGLERVIVDGPPFWSAVGYKPEARIT